MKTYHIVLTTIYDPRCLDEYYKNILKYGYLDDVRFWVVADKKTPLTCKERCINLLKKGLDIVFVDLEMQEKWLKPFPSFAESLPFNNDTRRNIGYLMAYEDNCQVLISIDDDNFPTDDDFIGGHSNVGKKVNNVIIDSSGYYNVCEHIEFSPNRKIYPRGFPFELREQSNSFKKIQIDDGFVGINAGLWLNAPDIDATTWLNGSVSGISFLGPKTFTLHNSTWSPVNTQNTSITRDLIPYYFCVPMGHEVPGGIIHRYGDIWGGYFCLSIMQFTKFHTSFGSPVANHNRNPHNYLVDLRQEFWGMLLTDLLLSHIKDFEQSENSIDGRSKLLIDKVLPDFIRDLPDWCAPEVREFIKKTSLAFGLYTAVAGEISK